MLRCQPALSVVFAVVLAPASLAAQARDTTQSQVVDSLVVTGRADDLIGLATTASEGRVGSADLRRRPITREGELLETVPGVIVTQHSGEGKANQYFLRGFNLDHGTDFQTRVEGMPVNLPSHAHGQGYTDLNFLVPELVDHLDYRLGVAHSEVGDFGSAGAAEFHLVRRLNRPFVLLGGGENGLARVAAGASTKAAGGDLLAGGEIKGYDGPWEVPQDIRKLSGLVRYERAGESSNFSLLAMAYHNRWNAPDQIPLRALSAGLISRYGQIDASDGGTASRYSLSGSWRHAGSSSVQAARLFAIYSELSLFSNFEYFLNDPVQGDQFNQQERRVTLGGEATHIQPLEALGAAHLIKAGLQTRTDLVRPVGLYRTHARSRLSTVREDRVDELAGGIFLEAESRWRPWLRTVVGARADGYVFDVSANIPENSGHRTARIVSPKASVVVTPGSAVELYLSGGLGFHSNDARGTTIRVDPETGAPAEQVDPVVRSHGAELGVRAAPTRGWRTTLALWALDLDSELLFVGDAGITEPSAASARHGVTWSNYWQPLARLTLDADLSLARARFTGVPAGEDRIPGSLETVMATGAAWNPGSHGPFGAIRLRHFGAYPLVEDNSVRATASTLVNADAGWLLASGLRLQLSLLNLFDARENDIQYYYTSRLPNEPAQGVDDVHVHPAEPRQVRLSLSWGL